MNQERLINVLRAPHVSEKSAIVAESNGQYVFKVADDATKPEIKAAVELMFNVEVNNVRTSTVKGKTKRFGQRMGRRNGWKKAYVTLKSDQEINLLGGAE